MRNTPTAEQIAKLPKWARDHIRDIERERDVAVRELNNHLDGQSKSPFYIDDMVCTGEEEGPTIKRCYVQTHNISVESGGIHLDVYAREDCIEMSWGNGKYSCAEVALIPESFQRARIKTAEACR